MAEWISVKDRLPDTNERVITFHPLMERNNSIQIEMGWAIKLSLTTHWMPIPEPPKEVSDG